MPPGSKKRKAAKKKQKESSLEKPSLDTQVDDSSATALPSPGSVDKEGSDSGSDILSPRTPGAPDPCAAESKEEGKESFSSGGCTAEAMDTSENGTKAAEAAEGAAAPVQTEEVGDVPPVEDSKAAEVYVTPPNSISEVPVSNDEGVAVEHVGDVPPAEEPEVSESYLTPPDSSYDVPLSNDGAGVAVERVEAQDAGYVAGPADAAVEPVVPTEVSRDVLLDEKVDASVEPVLAAIPRDVALDDKVDTTTEPTAIPREVLVNQYGAAAVEPAESPVASSEEPVAPEAGYVEVEEVEPSISVHPTSEVKEGEPISSAAHIEQPQATTETQAHTLQSRGLGAEQAVVPPQAAQRASWLNCCGLFDTFSGNR